MISPRLTESPSIRAFRRVRYQDALEVGLAINDGITTAAAHVEENIVHINTRSQNDLGIRVHRKIMGDVEDVSFLSRLKSVSRRTTRPDPVIVML
jgi:hypothetical protein